jgi:uncharacterized protein YndB with AHSA1/START domain
MAEIEHEIKIVASSEQVQKALTHHDSLSRWHKAKVEGTNDEIELSYPNGIVFRWRVLSSSPQKVIWHCLKGPGDSVGTEAHFKITSISPARTLVELTHRGWPSTYGNFRKCNTLWGGLLHRLKDEVEAAIQRSESTLDR